MATRKGSKGDGESRGETDPRTRAPSLRLVPVAARELADLLAPMTAALQRGLDVPSASRLDPFLQERLLDSPARQRLVARNSGRLQSPASLNSLLDEAARHLATGESSWTLLCCALATVTLAEAPVEHAAEATDQLDRAQLLAGRALAQLGHLEEATLVLAPLVEVTREASVRLPALVADARILCRLRRHEEAMERAQQALDASTDVVHLPFEREAGVLFAAARGAGGRSDRAAHLLARILGELVPEADFRLWLEAMFLLAWFCLELDSVARAERILDELQDLDVKLLTPERVLQLDWLTGRLAERRGEGEEAQLAFARAAERCQRLGRAAERAAIHLERAAGLAGMGRADEAAALLERGMPPLDAAGLGGEARLLVTALQARPDRSNAALVELAVGRLRVAASVLLLA